MQKARVCWLTCFIFYLIGQVFFLINIEFPSTLNFDEFHYIPSAKQFLAFIHNQNWEHPPLGKLMISFGIRFFGDHPLGWRLMSTVFGALTLAGVYALAFILFESQSTAVWVALLTLFNNLLYVQSRIAMIDTFMFGFLIWSLVFFAMDWKKDPSPSLQIPSLLAGLLLGLSTSCKWFSVIPWVGCAFLMLERSRNFYYWFLCFFLIPFISYCVPFLPFMLTQNIPLNLGEFFLIQKRMWDGQLRVVSSHPYMSHWIGWPLIKRPIWYAFDKAGFEKTRGVIMMGNPLIMWGGVLAFFQSLEKWLMTRDRTVFLILFLYGIFYFSWSIIPRKIMFYYYYYPAGMMLSFLLALSFQSFKSDVPRWLFLVFSSLLFVYFFPILAALKIDSHSFMSWMWFRSWI